MKLENAIQGHIPDIHLKAVINLEITNGWQSHIQDSFFKTYNLSRQQYNILRILRGQHPNGVTVKDIKSRMIDKMSNVSRLLDKMQEKGFINREDHADDRRVTNIYLTAAGLHVLEKTDVTLPTMVNSFKNLTAEEAELLNDLLEKWRDNG
jgi:DNA-binding MarR family transcriptional regulator